MIKYHIDLDHDELTLEYEGTGARDLASQASFLLHTIYNDLAKNVDADAAREFKEITIQGMMEGDSPVWELTGLQGLDITDGGTATCLK